MFDIGFAELLLIAVIALLVLGPERLPGAVRTTSLWLGRLRRSVHAIREEVEREFNTTELKQDRHNDAIMRQLGPEGDQPHENLDEVRANLSQLEYNLKPQDPEAAQPEQAGKHPENPP
jgi:sec-independent protein translocase protein TatB